MSELYEVTIERVAGPEVVMRVVTVHPDAGPPPESASFAMNLLTDYWSRLERGFASLLDGHGGTDAEAKSLANDPGYAETYAELRALSLGRSHPVEPAVHAALHAAMEAGELPLWNGEEVMAWGSSDGVPTVTLRNDPAGFTAMTERLVASCRFDDHTNPGAYDAFPEDPRNFESDDAAAEEAHWNDIEAAEARYDAALPTVRITVTMRDAKLVSFVRPDVTFGTAAYF